MTDNPIPAEPKHHTMHCETAHFGMTKLDSAPNPLEGCQCGNLIGKYDAAQDAITCQISMELINQLAGQKIHIVMVGERTEREDGASLVPIYMKNL